ncbi:MAG: GNAT family N-acetyltransferase [Bacteroidota bacterium]
MARSELHILTQQEIDPTAWDAFVKASSEGGFYAQHAYLTMLREDWKAYIVEEGGEWQAVMPFVINKRASYLSLPQLPFTQYLGVMFRPHEEWDTQKNVSSRHRWLGQLTEAWENIHLVVQNFSPAFDAGLPFHWADFELVYRYTYQLDLTQAEAKLRSGLGKNNSRSLKKGEQAGLSFRVGENKDAILHILKENKEQGRDLMGGHEASWRKIEDLCDYVLAHETADLVEVVDKNGQVVGANLLGLFGEKSYSLSGICLPEERKKGVMAFLMWHCLLHAKSKGKKVFDFEGSMIPGVAQFFQGFGAKPIPYLQIKRNRLPIILQWIQKLRT